MHLSYLHTAVTRGEFSLKFVAEDGQVISIPRCVCTSFHSAGRTLNIKLCDSGEIRKVVRLSIIELNGKQLYI